MWPAVLVCGGSLPPCSFSSRTFSARRSSTSPADLSSLVALAVMLRFWQPRNDLAICRTKIRTMPNTGAQRGRDPHEYTRAAKSPPPGSRGSFSRSASSSGACRSSGRFSTAASRFHANSDRDTIAIVVGTAERSCRRDRLQAPSPVLARTSSARCRRHRREGKPKAAEFRFNWLSATGTGIFLAAILSAFWMGISPCRFLRVRSSTRCIDLRWPLFTIACMLAIAYTTQYSGTDVTLGLAFTHTGVLYPFFAAMLGWLGVALTGSDTSQQRPVRQLATHHAPKRLGSESRS